jgi:hypothetical protein
MTQPTRGLGEVMNRACLANAKAWDMCAVSAGEKGMVGLSVQRLQHCATLSVAFFTLRSPVLDRLMLPQGSLV